MSEPNEEVDGVDEEEPVIITLAGEDGEEQTFQLIRVVEAAGRDYGLLVAVEEDEPSSNGTGSDDEDDDAGQLVVLRIVRDGDDEYFEEIEDEEEFQHVVAVLEQLADAEELGVER